SGANRAIDGKRHTFYTEGSLDLHQMFIISERLDGAEIRIGNSLDNNGNDNPRCATITHIPRGNTFTFTCQSGSMEGRYVNVVIPGDNKILTLCEVEVYADPTGDAATLTL
uniref:Fucolectin tachylectin-4 pentraxin-1 domain-containing protein n=1 Tax=Neogobius melanostomus TaxID=47308 RepID=A0A8C6SES3_9GOBI